MEEQKNLSAMEAEYTLAAPEEPAKKGLMRGARDFIENTFNSLKGKDLNQAIEEFTGDMTLVIEGMSEDLTGLRTDVDKASAQLTILAHEMDTQTDRQTQDISALRRDMEGLIKRMNALEKAQKDKHAAKSKGSLTGALRQVTWIACIICAAWVIVALLRFFGG